MTNSEQAYPLPEPMNRWSGYGGVTIAGDSWGDPDAPLVVLLHGAGQTRHAWKGLGERLGLTGYHSIAYDARGHGDSDWAPDGTYTTEASVADLISVVEKSGKTQPALVGASLGGATSLIAVGEGYVDAAALVLIDIAPRVEMSGVARIRSFMDTEPDGFESLDAVADAISNYQPHRVRPRSLDGLTKNVRLGADGKYRWHWDPKIREKNINFAQREARLSASAQNLTIPALLVRGALSDVLSEEGAAAFLELCTHSEYVNIQGANHMVAGDHNDIFASAVMEFLLEHFGLPA
jgi:pimeloyl-ACP methyl ester carboxylesterase